MNKTVANLAVSLTLLTGPLLHAETRLDLTFDDPQGLIRSQAQGVTSIGPDFARSTATIASGDGGRALPQITAGSESRPPGEDPAAQKFQVLTEPAMGSSAFVRLTLGPQSTAKSIGLGIIPAAAENGLSSLVAQEDGKITFSGGFDFFLRTGKEWSDDPPKLSVWTKVGPLTLHLEPAAKPGMGMTARITTGKPVISVNEGKSQLRQGVSTRLVNEAPIDPGEIYHVAVTFETAPDGAHTMKVYLQPGTGPLAAGKDENLNVSIENFRLEGPLEFDEGAGKITISLGRRDFAQTLDLSGFRIFKPAPDVFPGLSDKLP